MEFTVTAKHVAEAKTYLDQVEAEWEKHTEALKAWEKNKSGEKPVWNGSAAIKADRLKNPVSIAIAEALGVAEVCIAGGIDPNKRKVSVIYFPSYKDKSNAFVYIHEQLTQKLLEFFATGKFEPLNFGINHDKFPDKEVKNRESYAANTYIIRTKEEQEEYDKKMKELEEQLKKK